MIGFMLLFLLLIMIIGMYMYYHIYQVVKIDKYRKIVSLVILFVLLLFLFLFRLLMGFMVHLIVALIVVDITTLFLKKTKYKNDYHIEIIALIIACLLTGYGYYNAHHIQYVQYDVVIDKEFEDTRILAVSDLHLSTTIHYNDLKLIEEKAKQRDVDMIFILGDFFDESTDENEAKQAISFFDQLTEKYPVYYIIGNHDGSQGRKSVDEGLLKDIDDSRIEFLKDEVAVVQGIQIIGRLDRTYDRKETTDLMKKIDKDAPIVLLDHQPRQIEINASLGVDLQLSGHTHNGQIWPIGTICRLLKINEVEYGHVQVNDMDVIVSSGMGTWGFPLKSQGKSEMIEINLKHK